MGDIQISAHQYCRGMILSAFDQRRSILIIHWWLKSTFLKKIANSKLNIRLNYWKLLRGTLKLRALNTRLAKGRFFQKEWCIFLIDQKMCQKLSWKRYFEISFSLESADSNCTIVSNGGKIQNTKLRIEHSTFFGQWK